MQPKKTQQNYWDRSSRLIPPFQTKKSLLCQPKLRVVDIFSRVPRTPQCLPQTSQTTIVIYLYPTQRPATRPPIGEVPRVPFPKARLGVKKKWNPAGFMILYQATGPKFMGSPKNAGIFFRSNIPFLPSFLDWYIFSIISFTYPYRWKPKKNQVGIHNPSMYTSNFSRFVPMDSRHGIVLCSKPSIFSPSNNLGPWEQDLMTSKTKAKHWIIWALDKTNQWLFLVPLIGGSWYIITQ